MNKLTLVSVYWNGREAAAFVQGVLGEDGKTRVPYEVIKELLTSIGMPQNAYGLTFSIG